MFFVVFAHLILPPLTFTGLVGVTQRGTEARGDNGVRHLETAIEIAERSDLAFSLAISKTICLRRALLFQRPLLAILSLLTMSASLRKRVYAHARPEILMHVPFLFGFTRISKMTPNTN